MVQLTLLYFILCKPKEDFYQHRLFLKNVLNWVQWLVRIFLILLILYQRKSEVRKSKNWLRCFSRTSRLEAKGVRLVKRQDFGSAKNTLFLHFKNIQLCSSVFEFKKGNQELPIKKASLDWQHQKVNLELTKEILTTTPQWWTVNTLVNAPFVTFWHLEISFVRDCLLTDIYSFIPMASSNYFCCTYAGFIM